MITEVHTENGVQPPSPPFDLRHAVAVTVLVVAAIVGLAVAFWVAGSALAAGSAPGGCGGG